MKMEVEVNNIENSIKDMFLSQFKDKIENNMSCEEYLASLKKEEIEKLLKKNAIIEDNNKKLAYILAISVHKKNEVVEELKNTIDVIYKNILSNVGEDIFMQVEFLLRELKNETLELDVRNIKYSLKFIEFLKINCMAKIKYLRAENKLIIYMPNEIKKILLKISKNKNIAKINEKNSIYINNILNLLSTYGVISFKDLVNIYNKVYEEIKEEELLRRIKIGVFFENDIKIVLLDDDYLIYGIAFDEDEAVEFYYSLPDELDYKIYQKQEYEEIREGLYHNNFDDADKLFDFLSYTFNMNDDEIYDFDNMFVLDYLYSYQKDKDEAKRNLNMNMNNVFGQLNIMDKSFITKTILDIAKNYPNFNYKGYTYNEMKNLKLK